MDNPFFVNKGPVKVSEILNILNLKNKDLNIDQSIDDIKDLYNAKLLKHGLNSITTEIKQLTNYYLAEIYHQQYLSKPGSRPYCSAMPTKVEFKDFNGSNFKLNEKIWSHYNWEIRHCILRGDNTPIKAIS